MKIELPLPGSTTATKKKRKRRDDTATADEAQSLRPASSEPSTTPPTGPEPIPLHSEPEPESTPVSLVGNPSQEVAQDTPTVDTPGATPSNAPVSAPASLLKAEVVNRNPPSDHTLPSSPTFAQQPPSDSLSFDHTSPPISPGTAVMLYTPPSCGHDTNPIPPPAPLRIPPSSSSTFTLPTPFTLSGDDKKGQT